MTNKTGILIVDDETVFLESLATFFRRRDFEVECASRGTEAAELFESQSWDVIVLDMVLPDRDGIELMRYMIEEQPSTPIIIMTGYGTVETAIDATRLGAFDYVTKPFRPSKLAATVEVALAYRKLYNLLSSSLKNGLRSLLQSTFEHPVFKIGSDGKVQLASSPELEKFMERAISVVGQSFVRSIPIVAPDVARGLNSRGQNSQ